MILGPIAWLTILLFVAPLALVLAGLLVRHAARAAPDWQGAAEGRGLARRGDGPDPSYEGTVRGRAVEVVLRPAGPGRPSPVGILSVAFDDEGLGLRLRRQGVLDRYGRDQDHEIGDEAFDRRFVVQADEPARLRAWLSAARRGALLDALASFTRVEQGRLVAEVARGRGGDAFEPRLAALLELAEELEGSRPRAEAGPPTVVLRTAAGDPALDGAPLEVQPRAAAREAAARRAPEQASAAATEVLDVEPTGPSADAVALALFGDAAPSFEVRDRFDARFRGRPVAWTGVLVDRSASTAELELLALDPTSLTPRVVRARFEVPAESAATLAGREGEPVRVEARLAECDAFLRTLVLSEVTRVL